MFISKINCEKSFEIDLSNRMFPNYYLLNCLLLSFIHLKVEFLIKIPTLNDKICIVDVLLQAGQSVLNAPKATCVHLLTRPIDSSVIQAHTPRESK